MPKESPRQPACTSPIVFELLLTKNIGKQSATLIEHTRFPPLFIIPSAAV